MIRATARRDTLRLILAGAIPYACGLAACARPDSIGLLAPKHRSGDRELTIELWAGTAPDANDGSSPVIEIVTGKHGNRAVRGPLDWIDDRTGRNFVVYELVKSGEERAKRQLMTVTHGGKGLGRVLDQRTGAPARSFVGDVIFPLGHWTQGEERSFSSVEHTIAGPAKRLITIKIRQLHFAFDGNEHSLQYDRITRDAAKRILYKERCTYSPDKGLVQFTNLLKQDAVSRFIENLGWF